MLLKKSKYIVAILLLAAAFSCRSGQTSATASKCNCNSYTDTTRICYSAVGESRDEMYSKEKALSDARTGLASLLHTEVLAISNIFKDSEKGELETISDKRREATRQVVKQALSEIRITCEELITTADGTHKTYIRIEVKRSNIAKLATAHKLLEL